MKLQSIPFGTKPTLKNICLPRLLAMVKEAGLLANLSPFRPVGLMQHSGKNTGSLAVPFSITCQLNLTKPYNSVENIDKTSHFQNMAKLDKSALAGAAMLGAMAVDPALAMAAEKQNANAEFQVASITQQTRTEINACKSRLKSGELDRKEYRQCKRVAKRKASTERIASLDTEFSEKKLWLQKRGLDLNKDGEITDPQGRTLATITESNNALREGNNALREGNKTLQLEITELGKQYEQALLDFEKFLRGNLS